MPFRIKWFHLISLLSLFLIMQISSEALDIAAPITTDTTWTLSQSPVHILADINVDQNVTLTIEPGVEVRFGANYSLKIQGELQARGMSTSKIKFTADSNITSRGYWETIRFEPNSTDALYDLQGTFTVGSIIEHATIEYATNGIFCDSASPYIKDCFIHDCQTSLSGAGIYATNRSFPKVKSCTISSNVASGDGGGVCAFDANIILISCVISNNHAGGAGGGVIALSKTSETAMYNSLIQIIDTSITYNYATGMGGGAASFSFSSSPNSGTAIFLNTTLYLEGCFISQNQSSSSGGGVCSYAGNVRADLSCTNNLTSNFYAIDCNITHNFSTDNGGGIAAITSSSHDGNRFPFFGILVDVFSNIHLKNCQIGFNNSMGSGGGIYFDTTGIITGSSSSNSTRNDAESYCLLENCEISSNTSEYSGGGIYIIIDAKAVGWHYCETKSDISLFNCDLLDNWAQENGGGIGIKINGFTALDRFTTSARSSFYMDLESCRLAGNVAGENGGGIYACLYSSSYNDNEKSIAYCNSTITLSKCLILSNETGQSGGGLYNYAESYISNQSMIADVAADAYSTIEASNCIWANNSAGTNGGVIYSYSRSSINSWYITSTFARSSSNISLMNNTLPMNHTDFQGACFFSFSESIDKNPQSYSVISGKNCILWNIGRETQTVNGGGISFIYSDVKGGFPGTGNINADPLFANDLNLDFHLQYNSPCRDTGTSSGAPLSDIDNEPRPNPDTSLVDMGADEFYSTTIGTVTLTPTQTKTPSRTPTFTRTPSPTPTITLTFTPTKTPTSTPSFTATPKLFSVSMSPGWNTFTLPCEPSATLTAEMVIQEMSNSGLNCTSLANWQNGSWKIFQVGFPFNNFQLQLGQGYFSRCTNNGIWELGGIPFNESVELNMNIGWNFVGIPYSLTNYTSRTLSESINNTGGTVDYIANWDSGSWQIYKVGLPFNVFPIQNQKAYFLNSGNLFSWKP